MAPLRLQCHHVRFPFSRFQQMPTHKGDMHTGNLMSFACLWKSMAFQFRYRLHLLVLEDPF